MGVMLAIEDQIESVDNWLATLRIEAYAEGRRWLKQARDARTDAARDAALDNARARFIEAERPLADDDLALSVLALNVFLTDANRGRRADALVALRRAHDHAVDATNTRRRRYDARRLDHYVHALADLLIEYGGGASRPSVNSESAPDRWAGTRCSVRSASTRPR